MINIRNYQEEDAEETWLLFYNTTHTINIRDYTSDQVSAWAPDNPDMSVWKSKMSSINPFVAEMNDVIVGYSNLQSSGLIDHFFCHHNYKSLGIGKALMSHIFEQGKDRGIHRFCSEVSITAKPFYEHFGFLVVKEQIFEVRGQNLTYYIMEKKLTSS